MHALSVVILSLVPSIPFYFVKSLAIVKLQPRAYVYNGPFSESPVLTYLSCQPDVLVQPFWAPCFLISEMSSLE